MEDYEAQEIEFWAKLEEEGMSRSSMLRRSAAAAFGLTIVGGASTAFAANKAAMAAPTHMTKEGLKALVAAAKNCSTRGRQVSCSTGDRRRVSVMWKNHVSST